ncbi:MAG: NADH-quinone oxidoreductase subunit C [Elusimicrobia bacterium]|nr:NADH-quinone oxidoreductase subunit C [Elusimicrobiota bacterium]
MTQDELFAKIQGQFPQVQKAQIQVKDYLTVRLSSKDDLLPLSSWLKENSFDYLDMLTGTDYLGPTDMKGYISQPNFNPFLPEGATPQIEPSAAAGFPYRPVLDLLWSFVSLKEKQRVIVKLELQRDSPSVPSLTGLFKAADWQERETYDLLGVRYEGHPNLTKILTPEFTSGHPLRKDYAHVKDRFDE